MVARIVTCATLFALLAAPARAIVNPFIFGGRAEYQVQYQRDPNPFPFNVSGNSAVDRTLLMLDLKTKQPTYGALYLRGSAVWDDVDAERGQKAFQFDQGDYYWRQQLSRWQYGVRAFANERRFFVYDMIAPLIDDDRIDGNDNLGIRFDADVNERGTAIVLYSSVGSDLDSARQLMYLKAGYAWRPIAVSASYLYEEPGAFATRNRAVFKVEFATGYRMVSLIAAYNRTERSDERFYFPGGGLALDKLTDGIAAVVAPGAALHAEVRINPIKVPVGRLWVVYRYDITGNEYAAEFARLDRPARLGHTPALYYKADKVNLNARLLYHHGSRFVLESEDRDIGELGVWATLRNGTDLLLRGRIANIEEDSGLPANENFVHLGVRYTKRKVQSGMHVMWKDIDTDFSGLRYAWDGKVSVSANWRFDWRVVTDETLGVGQQPFLRLEYRPNNRLYMVLSYGRQDIGDGPFVLEDRDVGLSRANDQLYRLGLRGDF